MQTPRRPKNRVPQGSCLALTLYKQLHVRTSEDRVHSQYMAMPATWHFYTCKKARMRWRKHLLIIWHSIVYLKLWRLKPSMVSTTTTLFHLNHWEQEANYLSTSMERNSFTAQPPRTRCETRRATNIQTAC